LLLLLTFAIALLFIRALRMPLLTYAPKLPGVELGGDWSVSWSTGEPVAKHIGQRLSNTLILLGTAILVALLLALVAALVGVLAH